MATHLSPGTLIALIASTAISAVLAKGIYNVYFHPLAKVPGPFLSSFTEFLFIYKWLCGDLVKYIDCTHKRYGKTVRLAPNRISYIEAEVWKDIYGHKTGSQKKVAVMKDPQLYGPDNNGRFSLLATFDDQQHGKLRRIFAHGFSDRALKAQEPIIKAHVKKLISNVHGHFAATPNTPLDFVRIFNCVTFDVIAELAFGESFGLQDGNEKNYSWITNMDDNLRLAPFLTLAIRFPLVMPVLKLFLPKSVQASSKAADKFSSALVDKRLAKGKVTEKPDFWSLILKDGESTVIDTEDMKANANLFMAAGSETTATMLSGLMYRLILNPEKRDKLTKEVRDAFHAEEDMTLEKIQGLQYMAACFEESMRLYPSTPLGPPRVVLGAGGEVKGQYVPPKTNIAISIYSANRSPHNFKDPDSFVPERWIPTDPLFAAYSNDRRDVFQPFSYGPRNCIGKNLALHEMRLIATSLLWGFDFELDDKTGDWFDQKMYWALWHKKPLWLKATPVKR